ncbi:flagellar motor protein MotB [Endozoicomonas sp. SM1973]|uniref:Flagellar motor protein MotB n=1 Tax=Spartinivicinus marinus TaxID=2994442 RepID=A0A853I360_9GAMM|nr:flagellar motor protein MotB [Spartinivicinus marinus]MCX4027043.1 flagellar motor protein MotB [Spartinivicinus marinus]NYZ67039.1 flagellar motor protein MotB [Spartinivicinus marinus]
MRMSELDLNDSQDDSESKTAFYISFSDLMVMLGVFFVMLLSISQVDVGSFEKVKTGVTGNTSGTLVELSNNLAKIVEDDPDVSGVSVRMAKDGIRLVLDTKALFETGSANLKPQALDSLEPILLSILATKYTIDVEGHTDDAPLHRYYRMNNEYLLETNWSLSGRRASSVIHFLLQFGFTEKRLRLVGYASTRPINRFDGKKGTALEAARANNRRVSLLVK